MVNIIYFKRKNGIRTYLPHDAPTPLFSTFTYTDIPTKKKNFNNPDTPIEYIYIFISFLIISINICS